jgi:hypothetical protein
MALPVGSAPWEERFQSGGHSRDDQEEVEARAPMDRIGSSAGWAEVKNSVGHVLACLQRALSEPTRLLG